MSETEVSSFAIAEEAEDGEDVIREAGVVQRRRERVPCRRSCACSCGSTLAAGVPELVGVAADILRVRGALEAMQDEGGRRMGTPGCAGCQWQWQSTRELSCMRVAGSGGATSTRRPGVWRAEMIGTREKVSGDGLKVRVCEEAAWPEARHGCNIELWLSGSGRRAHAGRPPAWVSRARGVKGAGGLVFVA